MQNAPDAPEQDELAEDFSGGPGTSAILALLFVVLALLVIAVGATLVL
jgi:hypothetical protein